MTEERRHRVNMAIAVALALVSASIGALVQGYVQALHTGERLAAIEQRLTSVEVQLRRITCVGVVGVSNCSGDRGGQ